MDKLGNLLGIAGILLCLYALVGRFVGGATIGYGIIAIEAKSGLILANSILLIAILLKQSGK